MLKRLQFAVQDKFFKVITEEGLLVGVSTYEVNAETRKKARERWRAFCDSMGFVRLSDENDFDPHGQIFEESIAIRDPAPNGGWLDMSKETALKILAMGMP